MQYPRRRPPHSISIGGLRTPAPVCAAPPSWGRHPQTFTQAVAQQLIRFYAFSYQSANWLRLWNF